MKKFLTLISIISLLSSCGEASDSAGTAVVGTGQGGSLARFTTVGDYLYAVDESSLQVFDINDPRNSTQLSKIDLGIGAETIFPLNDTVLLIGTNSGVDIFDLSNAPTIKRLSRYEHLTACDPVVANENYAYVTLRSEQGNRFCWRSVNELQVLDISDLEQPQLVQQIPMIQPRGLGLYGDTLLVCDQGIKVFDLQSPRKPSLLKIIDSFNPRDIIPRDSLMIFVGSQGLEQYRYKNGQFELLSQL